MKSKYTMEQVYAAYEQQRNKTRDTLRRKGIDFRPAKLDEDQFYYTFNRYKYAYKAEGINAPSAIKIAQEIAREDYNTGGVSMAQAKALKKAYKEVLNQSLTLVEIRAIGVTGALDKKMRDAAKEAREAGKKGKEVSVYVGQHIFGSP